ncbi:MAG: hypothetical protein IPL35_15830 [Sphingobacteriales bacterium]|nr:hypothetical protein [Sphingobacteriales bacterium]
MVLSSLNTIVINIVEKILSVQKSLPVSYSEGIFIITLKKFYTIKTTIWHSYYGMVIMSLPIELIIKESADYLKQLHKKAKRKGVYKIKMLMNIQSGIHHNHLLAIKSGASVRSINRWKATYQSQGLDGLLRDNRGGDFRSQLETADKERISQKLKDPKNGLHLQRSTAVAEVGVGY